MNVKVCGLTPKPPYIYREKFLGTRSAMRFLARKMQKKRARRSDEGYN